MDERVFGYHLIVNCTACDKDKITSKENIEEFSKQLVEKIDMIAYGNAQVVHFAAHNPKAGGYTLLQLIETSNISAHFVDDSGNAFIDIFSCKSFDKKDALKVVKDCFNPKAISHKFFTRKA